MDGIRPDGLDGLGQSERHDHGSHNQSQHLRSEGPGAPTSTNRRRERGPGPRCVRGRARRSAIISTARDQRCARSPREVHRDHAQSDGYQRRHVRIREDPGESARVLVEVRRRRRVQPARSRSPSPRPIRMPRTRFCERIRPVAMAPISNTYAPIWKTRLPAPLRGGWSRPRRATPQGKPAEAGAPPVSASASAIPPSC